MLYRLIISYLKSCNIKIISCASKIIKLKWPMDAHFSGCWPEHAKVFTALWRFNSFSTVQFKLGLLLFQNFYTCMRKNYCKKLFSLRGYDFLKITVLKNYFCFTVLIARKRTFLRKFSGKDYRVDYVFHNSFHILEVTDESTFTH